MGNLSRKTFEGLPIIDADEDVHIQITKGDVNKSRVKDPSSCAAALACRRAYHTDVRVYMTRMYLLDKKNKRWIRFQTPERITREITAFDRGAAFEPGEYVFKAPGPTSRLGTKHIGGEPTGKGKKQTPFLTKNVRATPRKSMK